MTDYISARERLSNPLFKWVREDTKIFLLSVVLFTSFLLVITKPGGFI